MIGQSACPACTAGYVVNSLVDNTANEIITPIYYTLREATLAANKSPANGDYGSGSIGNDTIAFNVSGTISFSLILPTIVSNQGTLSKDSGGNITISGKFSGQVMAVNSDLNYTLHYPNINNENSRSGYTGGIENKGALLLRLGALVGSLFNESCFTNYVADVRLWSIARTRDETRCEMVRLFDTRASGVTGGLIRFVNFPN